jgi:hypothetical protein
MVQTATDPNKQFAIETTAALIASLATVATVTACTSEPEKVAEPPATSSSPAPPAERAACPAALPDAWQQAIDQPPPLTC